MVVEKFRKMGVSKSRIRVLFEYGMEQAAKVGKENVFDFSIGNPSVPAPQKVADTVRELLEMDPIALHGYTPAGGCAEAREAIAADLTKRAKAPIRPENIFFTCGAAPAMTACMQALAVENAEFLVIAPYFSEYPAYCASTGAKCVVVPPDTDRFQIRFDELEKRITPNTQAVIINSPNNPSGVIYFEETLQRLGEILTRKGEEIGHPIYVLSDEPYRELTYDGLDFPYVPNIYPNTVICYSYSKILSMPGERIGYVCVPDCCADSEALYAAVAGAARAIGHVCAPSLWQRVVARCTELPDHPLHRAHQAGLPLRQAPGRLLHDGGVPRRRLRGLLRPGQGPEHPHRPLRRLRLPRLHPLQHLREPRHDPALSPRFQKAR